MFDTIHSHIVAEFNGKMPPDGAVPVCGYLETYLQDIAGQWAEEGFSGLQLTGAADTAAPQLCAVYEGETVYICLPHLLTAQMIMEPLPAETAAYCEEEIPQARVFYANLTGVETGDSWQLHASNCVPVRNGGEWLDDLEYQQCLPYSVRSRWSRHTDFLGPLELAKIGILIPYIQSHCEPFDLFLPGVFSQEELASSPYRLFVARGLDFCMLQVARSGEDAGEVCAMHFCVANAGQAVLMVRETPAEGDYSGLLPVTAPNGAEIAVSCPQAACMPQAFEPGMALQGYFNLYADGFESGEHTFTVQEGPLYHEACRSYREEHGCEPPEGFGAIMSTDGMRAINGDDDGSAEVYGVVKEITPCRREFLQLTCYTVLCCADDDETVVNVYVHDHLRGDFDPQPGDTICCTGSLHFLAQERVEPSQELTERMAQQKGYTASQDTYMETLPYGMGHALVARSVLHWGWELVDTPCTGYYSNCFSLLTRRPDGVFVAIYVDTVINGVNPVLAFNQDMMAAHMDHYRSQLGEDALSCHATIRLDLDPEIGYYHVHGSVEPDITPELSLPVQMRPYSPALYDEDDKVDLKGAVSAFCEACNEGDWGPFVRWVRDDAHYEEPASRLEFHTKEDTMRYVAMQIRDTPEDARFIPGKIAVQGGFLYAAACMSGSNVEHCYTVDVEDGMVVTVVLLPPALHDRFTPGV